MGKQAFALIFSFLIFNTQPFKVLDNNAIYYPENMMFEKVAQDKPATEEKGASRIMQKKKLIKSLREFFTIIDETSRSF